VEINFNIGKIYLFFEGDARKKGIMKVWD